MPHVPNMLTLLLLYIKNTLKYKLYPMKRVCEVEEIASVVSFLSSKESSYINGQTICVDGGIGILSPALTEFDDANSK